MISNVRNFDTANLMIKNMFTGIIEDLGVIEALKQEDTNLHLTIKSKLTRQALSIVGKLSPKLTYHMVAPCYDWYCRVFKVLEK